MNSTYTIVYTISNRTKRIDIEAPTSMLALRKFKEMMPSLIYKNLALKSIEEPKEPKEKKNKRQCFYCTRFVNPNELQVA